MFTQIRKHPWLTLTVVFLPALFISATTYEYFFVPVETAICGIIASYKLLTSLDAREHTATQRPYGLVFASVWFLVFTTLQSMSWRLFAFFGFLASGPIMSPTADNSGGMFPFLLVTLLGAALMATISFAIGSYAANCAASSGNPEVARGGQGATD